MSVIDIHGRLANTALFYVAIMGIWGLYRFFRRQGVDGSYWGALIIAEVLLLVQALLGAYIWVSGAGFLPRPAVHILYGVVSILIIPGVFLYTRGDDHRRVSLIYGAAFLFLIGIVLRGMSTAG